MLDLEVYERPVPLVLELQGTDKTSSYIPFAVNQNGNFIIAVRPLFSASPSSISLGMRVRAMVNPAIVNAGEIIPTDGGNAMAAAFPNVDWRKQDSSRVSTVVGFGFNVGVSDIKSCYTVLKNTDCMERMVESLINMVKPLQFSINAVELRNYMQAVFLHRVYAEREHDTGEPFDMSSLEIYTNKESWTKYADLPSPTLCAATVANNKDEQVEQAFAKLGAPTSAKVLQFNQTQAASGVAPDNEGSNPGALFPQPEDMDAK